MSTTSSRRRLLYVFAAYTGVFVLLSIYGYYLSSSSEPLHKPIPVSHHFVSDLTYYDMPRMTIELSGSSQGSIRLDLSLEVAKKDITTVEGYQPRITDRLTNFFLHVNPERFSDARTLPWLRQQMLLQVNNATPVPVHDLLLRQLVIM